MKEFKLLKLQLDNFKGIKNLVINAYGADLDIYGDNATGKTTIADAFSWLLFGKDSTGRADFEIKTLDENGQPIHFLDHSVYAELELDGNKVELQKVYREKWVKQRGSFEREFSGYETEYLINGVPKSKAEYTAFIKSVADEDVFRLLTNPMYFNNNIDKKKRREMLFNIFGGLTDIEVIAENTAEIGGLAEYIGRYTIDELRAVTVANKRKINESLQAIPNRIDEANRYIVEVEAEQEIASLEIEVVEIEAEIERKKEQQRNLSANAEYDIQYKKWNDDVAKVKTEHLEKTKELSDTLTNLIKQEYETQNEISRTNFAIQSAEQKIRNSENGIETYNAKLDELRAEWQTVFDSEYTGDSKCPTCNQELPEERIAEAIKQFNENKALKLKKIDTNAETFKSSIENCNEAIVDRKYEIGELEAKRASKEAELKTVKEKKAEIKKTVDEYETEKDNKIAELNSAWEAWKSAYISGEANNTVLNTLKEETAKLQAEKDAKQAIIHAVKSNAKFKARINELEAEARSLSAEYERLEHLDYLIGEFTKVKASMLENKINSKFQYAKFKLFDTQINGGVVETCEVTYEGVPYSVLNSAMRINIGLDIINAFSEHYGLETVIFLDNAESVTNILKTKSQLISLYVSEADKTLRIE